MITQEMLDNFQDLRFQCQMTVEYMEKHGKISTFEANKELGFTRLSAIIFDLKEKGFKIGDSWKSVTNRYGRQCRIKEYFILEYPKKITVDDVN